MPIAFDREIERAVNNPSKMRDRIKEGLTIDWLNRLAKLFGISPTAFANIVGIDTRTLTRRRREGKLTAKESSSLYHLAVLYEHAFDVLGDTETVQDWFSSPEPDFAGMKPVDLLDTAPGIKEVHQLLGRIEHGVF
jgi:putative toxin-antitoxin system antitoxin component (TIGR02293 family)